MSDVINAEQAKLLSQNQIKIKEQQEFLRIMHEIYLATRSCRCVTTVKYISPNNIAHLERLGYCVDTDSMIGETFISWDNPKKLPNKPVDDNYCDLEVSFEGKNAWYSGYICARVKIDEVDKLLKTIERTGNSIKRYETSRGYH